VLMTSLGKSGDANAPGLVLDAAVLYLGPFAGHGHHPQGALWAPCLSDDPGLSLRAVGFLNFRENSIK